MFVNASHHKSISIEVYGGDFSNCLDNYNDTCTFVDSLRTNFLDEEWFGYETAGTLVVGWEGGPAKPVEPRGGKRLEDEEEAELARLHTSRLDPLDLAEHESRPKTTATGIEIAAALATGTECSLVNSWRRLICICNQEMFFDITQKFLILYMYTASVKNLLATPCCYK